MKMAAMLRPNKGKGLGSLLKLHRDGSFGEVSIGPSYWQPSEKMPVSQAGISVAINYLTLGVPALSANSTGRGGARNRADRESQALSARHIGNLLAAANHAEAIGLPLNRMITVHWQTAGIPLEAMAKATGRFTDLLGKAVARHGHATAWLWVHESGAGKGGHCHLLVHLPPHIIPAMTAAQRRWIKAITGQPYRKRTILSKPIGGILAAEARNPDLHAANLAAALSYVLKGADAGAAAQFNLSRLEPGGRIIGRRCSTSENIGAAARKAGGVNGQ
ncbi:MAG: hypothetical protein INF18_08555 [Methylobacterium sp.]|nr:hypothetical protein [Methylobacterium sp.]MCA3640093.1 hypothetical protein [Methylobacterium sp.]